MSLRYLIEIAIQIGFCFHAVRTGRGNWMFIILFIPFVGWLAYLVIEVLPSLFSGPKAALLKGEIKRSLNPHKDLKDARYAFEMTPTVANRLQYGRALIERKSFDQAIEVLKPGLTNFFKGDPALLEGLATAYYEKGSDAEALPYITQILDNEEWPVKPATELLAARIHDHLGDKKEAEAFFARLATTSAGEEAKVAYGQFLLRENRAAEAKPIFADIEKRSHYMSRHARKIEAQWIKIAQRELARL